MDATVVKVGGSLASYPDKLKALCLKLNDFSQKKILIVPGGGEFADKVREADNRFNLSHQTSHRMAILGMDQYGLLLSNLMQNSCVVYQLEDVAKVWRSDRLPIFLPSQFLLKDDFLENSWDVTSDTITVYISSQLHINRAVLVTDVDGIFAEDPKKVSSARLIKNLSSQELLAMNRRTSVDKFLPKLILQLHIECFVVNGQYPIRVESILKGKNAVCSRIFE